MEGDVMTVSITKRPESSSSCMAGYSSSDSEFESCNPKPSKPRLTNKKQPNRPTSGRPKSGVQQRVRPSPDRLKDDTFMKADSDQIDLDTLLHAVLDINERLRIQESRLEETRNGGRIKRQRPHSAHALKTAKSYIDDPDVDIPGRGSTKVCQRPSSAKVLKPDKPLPHEKKNFSFANDKVDEIDRENQRLLREIMRKQKKEQTRLKPKLEPMRVGHIKPPSEINRSRHQSQIERENLAFLKRLEAVKPTTSLSRDHLLKEHFKQTKYSQNSSKTKSRPSSANLNSRRSASWNDLRDLDSLQSSRTSLSSSRRRPASGRSSVSARRTEVKPIWEPGW